MGFSTCLSFWYLLISTPARPSEWSLVSLVFFDFSAFHSTVLRANMDEKIPPFFRITDDDQGGIAVVVAVNAIIVSSVVCGIRSLVAGKQHIGFQADDVTFYIAGVSSL